MNYLLMEAESTNEERMRAKWANQLQLLEDPFSK